MPATNTASLLPIIPRIFFLYCEPVIITIGIFMTQSRSLPLFDNVNVHLHLPVPALLAPSMVTSHLITVLLYGLLVLVVAPPSRRLAQLHILTLALADLTHWYGVLSTLARVHGTGGGEIGGVVGGGGDWAAALDTSNWDEDTWGMMLGPLATFAVKVATLAGVFGRIRDA